MVMRRGLTLRVAIIIFYVVDMVVGATAGCKNNGGLVLTHSTEKGN